MMLCLVLIPAIGLLLAFLLKMRSGSENEPIIHYAVFLTTYALWVFHMADSTVALFLASILAIAYLMYRQYCHLKWLCLLPTGIVTIAAALILLQKTGAISFPTSFTFSNLLLGGAYEGSSYEMDFAFKYNVFSRTIPIAFLYVFIFTSLIVAILADRSAIPAAVGAVGLAIFFLPDPISYRISGYFVPFFIMVLAFGFTKFLGYILSCSPKAGKPFLVGLFVLALITPVASMSYNSFYDYSLSKVARKQIDRVINEAPYEYKATMWVRENLPKETRVISDIWTVRFITGIANTLVSDEDYPWDRLKFDETSYQFEPLYGQFVEELKALLLLENSQDLYSGVKAFSNAPNIVVVVSGRTEDWSKRSGLNLQNDMSKHGVSPQFLSMYLDNTYFTPLYKIDDKVYLFTVKSQSTDSSGS